MNDAPEVTEILLEWSEGDPSALERLIPFVYDELRAMASRFLRNEHERHTLQPTALINEVYLRLIEKPHPYYENRAQFFRFSARLMRHILIDHARARQATKRGKEPARVSLDEAMDVLDMRSTDLVALVALDEALSRLSELDPRQGEIVGMRYFLGLTNNEIANTLGISVATVKREWHVARLWLYRELKTN